MLYPGAPWASHLETLVPNLINLWQDLKVGPWLSSRLQYNAYTGCNAQLGYALDVMACFMDGPTMEALAPRLVSLVTSKAWG
jgi:hypothetical protein